MQAAAISPTMDKLKSDEKGRVTCVSGAVQAAQGDQEEEVNWQASEQSVRVNRSKIKLANALWEVNSLLPAAPVKVIGCVGPQGSKKNVYINQGRRNQRRCAMGGGAGACHKGA